MGALQQTKADNVIVFTDPSNLSAKLDWTTLTDK